MNRQVNVVCRLDDRPDIHTCCIRDSLSTRGVDGAVDNTPQPAVLTSLLIGRRMMKAVPRPTVLSTRMRPW